MTQNFVSAKNFSLWRSDVLNNKKSLNCWTELYYFYCLVLLNKQGDFLSSLELNWKENQGSRTLSRRAEFLLITYRFSAFPFRRCKNDDKMGKVPFVNVEKLPPPMAASVSDHSRNCHSGAVQRFVGAHQKLSYTWQVLRTVYLPSHGASKYHRYIVCDSCCFPST